MLPLTRMSPPSSPMSMSWPTPPTALVVAYDPADRGRATQQEGRAIHPRRLRKIADVVSCCRLAVLEACA
jgi:hypothetical protein